MMKRSLARQREGVFPCSMTCLPLTPWVTQLKTWSDLKLQVATFVSYWWALSGAWNWFNWVRGSSWLAWNTNTTEQHTSTDLLENCCLKIWRGGQDRHIILHSLTFGVHIGVHIELSLSVTFVTVYYVWCLVSPSLNQLQRERQNPLMQWIMHSTFHHPWFLRFVWQTSPA